MSTALIRPDSLFDRIKQYLSWKWLAKIRDAACSNGLAFDRGIVVSGHKNHGEFVAVRCQLTRQFHAGKVAEFNINKEAIRLACRSTGEKRLS